jgi:hypothetical protein
MSRVIRSQMDPDNINAGNCPGCACVEGGCELCNPKLHSHQTEAMKQLPSPADLRKRLDAALAEIKDVYLGLEHYNDIDDLLMPAGEAHAINQLAIEGHLTLSLLMGRTERVKLRS